MQAHSQNELHGGFVAFSCIRFFANHGKLSINFFRQADEGHTTVEFLLKFNGGKEASTKKLRKIVKTGDIAGISVDSSYFKIDWYVLYRYSLFIESVDVVFRVFLLLRPILRTF